MRNKITKNKRWGKSRAWHSKGWIAQNVSLKIWRCQSVCRQYCSIHLCILLQGHRICWWYQKNKTKHLVKEYSPGIVNKLLGQKTLSSKTTGISFYFLLSFICIHKISLRVSKLRLRHANQIMPPNTCFLKLNNNWSCHTQIIFQILF